MSVHVDGPEMSKILGERAQLSLFNALPCADLAPRDAQDLMAYPFFSLAKSRRTAPIRFEAGDVSLVVEGLPEHGIATIWDADVLIWAASCEGSIGCCGCSPGVVLRDWESPNPLSNQSRSPDEHP